MEQVKNARLRSIALLFNYQSIGFGDVREDRQTPGPKGKPALSVIFDPQDVLTGYKLLHFGDLQRYLDF